MLVIQHIRHLWSKGSRGANTYARPILDRVYPLPEPSAVENPQQQALVHSISSDMWREPIVMESAGVLSHADWIASDSTLDWQLRGADVAITLRSPSRWRLQTGWPRWLPAPLFVLRPGETARIEWNGRFRYSLFGSNRSSYYEQHVYWLAVTDAPHERLFLDAKPRKDIDLRRHIY